jgi:hypothetical protein
LGKNIEQTASVLHLTDIYSTSTIIFAANEVMFFFVLELKNKCHKKIATRPRKPETKGSYGFPGVYKYV